MKLTLAAAVAALTILGSALQTADARAISYRFVHRSHWRENPQVNVYLSARYDRLLQISPRFRHYRMWKECHSITWPGLRDDCIASFDQYEPAMYAR